MTLSRIFLTAAAALVAGKVTAKPAPRRERHINQIISDVPRDFFNQVFFARYVPAKRRR